jgi:GntR family transcriptional regulator, vanillate catabolism transcriptional regulator
MTKPLKPGQRVIAALRSMIASGELRDGERIAEIQTAERLGVSRMPVRTALRALEQEGLVVRLGARGYAARGATRDQVEGAIEVRGVLEGLAARRAAQHPDHARIARRLEKHVRAGAAIFESGDTEGYFERFYACNLAFHDQLLTESGNEAIRVALARNDHLPFASASAIVVIDGDPAADLARLARAHAEHVAVTAAIAAGDADTAERVMRDHARRALGDGAIFERLGGEVAAPLP